MDSNKLIKILENRLNEQDDKEVIKYVPEFPNTSISNKPVDVVFFKFASPSVIGKVYGTISAALREKYPAGMTTLNNSNLISINKSGSEILTGILKSIGFSIIDKT